MLRGKSKFLQAVIILGLLGAIGGTGILIFEAATPGKQSANQSTAVGTQIASIINEHETNDKDVEPTSVSIKNPVASLKVGDTYLLETEVLPEDTTFPALSFASSVETVARISGDGLITALSAGSTTISASQSSRSPISPSPFQDPRSLRTARSASRRSAPATRFRRPCPRMTRPKRR